MAPSNNSDISSESTSELEEFFKDLSILKANKIIDQKVKSNDCKNEEKATEIDELITNINNICIDETKYEIKSEDKSISDKIIDLINNSEDVNEKHPGKKEKKFSCRNDPFSGRISTYNDQGNNNLSSSSNNVPTLNYNLLPPAADVADYYDDYSFDFPYDIINSDTLSIDFQLPEVLSPSSQNNLNLSSENNPNYLCFDLNQSPSSHNNANISSICNSIPYCSNLNGSSSSASSPNYEDSNGSPPSVYNPNYLVLNGSPPSAYSPNCPYLNGNSSSSASSPISSLTDDNSSSQQSPSPVLYDLDQNPVLPLTLNNIDEINQSKVAQIAMQDFADSQRKLKKIIWIKINNQSVEQLIVLLKQSMNQTKINTSFVIKIYAIIFRLIKDETQIGKQLLKDYFTTDLDILWKIFEKDNIILWNYLIEVMQNLGINPNHLKICEQPFLHYIIKNMKTDLNKMFEAVLNTPSIFESSNKLFDIDENDKQGNSLMIVAIQQISKVNDDLENVAIKNMTSIINQKPNMYSLSQFDNSNIFHTAILLKLKPEIIKKMFVDRDTIQYLLYHTDFYNFTPIDLLKNLDTSEYKDSVMTLIKNYLDKPYI